MTYSAADWSVCFPWSAESAEFYLPGLSFVVSSSCLFGHMGLSHILFLACILVRFRQGEKNGCVNASTLVADYLVQLLCQRHGIVYFPTDVFVMFWNEAIALVAVTLFILASCEISGEVARIYSSAFLFYPQTSSRGSGKKVYAVCLTEMSQSHVHAHTSETMVVKVVP